jgi:hypothetical protein
MQKGSAQQRLPGGMRHCGWIRGRKVRRESRKFPEDPFRHALRRERQAENRYVSGFSTEASFYKGQIMLSVAE